MSKLHHIQSAEQLQQLLSSNRVVVVDLWCGPCKVVAKPLEQLAEQLTEPGKMAFAKVDVDQQKDIAAAYQIKAMPTFITFKDGKAKDRTEGADLKKLTEKAMNLFNEIGGSGEGSSGGGGDEWLAVEAAKGYSSIVSEIDIKGLDIMNAKSELGSIRSLFSKNAPSSLPGGKSRGKAKTSDGAEGEGSVDWVESDTDEQLMLFIPFQATVKIFQLQITSIPKEDDDDDEAAKRPKTIKLYTNSPHILGFEDADGREETQLISFSPEDWKDGTATINTRFVKFQAVSTLTLFIEEAEDGAEAVRVDRIRVIGDSGEKRDPGKLEKISD